MAVEEVDDEDVSLLAVAVAASDPLFDASGTDLRKYLGGDFQGLRAKIPYLRNMGISAIWITSIVPRERCTLRIDSSKRGS